MILIGRDKLDCLKEEGDQVAKWKCSWITEIINAHWRQASDVFEQFPRVKINDKGCFEFSVGNEKKWVICIQITFSRRVVIVQEVKGEK